jgi:hypothetical protein
MLRKLVRSGLLSAFGAVATMSAGRASAAIWRFATGEEPPERG